MNDDVDGDEDAKGWEMDGEGQVFMENKNVEGGNSTRLVLGLYQGSIALLWLFCENGMNKRKYSGSRRKSETDAEISKSGLYGFFCSNNGIDLWLLLEAAERELMDT